MSDSLLQRFEALEQRVKHLEDIQAIQKIISSYGPAVDGLDGEALAAMWAADGTYDFGIGDPLRGRENVAKLIELDSHKSYVTVGCAHVLSSPRIEISGDKAVAVNYSQVFVRSENGWRADRTGANRWEFVRTVNGWQVSSRSNSLLNGTAAARTLLQR